MIKQMSIDDFLHKTEPEARIEIPIARSETEKIYTIPQDVWENRCQICVHKKAEENRPIPLWAVYSYQYDKIIPCRIMGISRPNDRPGECMSFAPIYGLEGICESCQYNNQFCEGFCTKENHAPQRRVYWGGNYGGDERKRDYWGRHRFSVCDDYKRHSVFEERDQK